MPMADQSEQIDQELEDEGLVYQKVNLTSLGKDAWDDSALIQAWDQAVKDYKSAHPKDGTKRSANTALGGDSPSSNPKLKSLTSAAGDSPTPTKGKDLSGGGGGNPAAASKPFARSENGQKRESKPSPRREENQVGEAAAETSPGKLKKNAAGEKSPSGKSRKWKVGDRCLARYSRDAKWYEAEILQELRSRDGKTRYRVHYTDYEGEETLPATSILPLPAMEEGDEVEDQEEPEKDEEEEPDNNDLEDDKEEETPRKKIKFASAFPTNNRAKSQTGKSKKVSASVDQSSEYRHHWAQPGPYPMPPTAPTYPPGYLMNGPPQWPHPSQGRPYAAPHAPTFPPMYGGGSSDEDLGNLLMAWYFSGYYTGLHQARRRG